MKKAVFVLLILFVCAGGAFAQISFGLNAGVEYSIIEMPEVSGISYNFIGFPAQVFGLYQLPMTVPIEGFGEATVSAGLTSGFINNILGTTVDSDSSLNSTFSVVPILGMARLKVDFLYVDLGAGIYFPTAEGENDIPYGGYSEVGYAHALNENLSLTIGGRYTFVGTNADAFNIVGVVAGVEYSL